MCICSAPEDLDQGEHLRSLLEDLQNVRQDKIRNGLSRIAGDVVQSGGSASVIQMNNISALEINSVREFMIGVRLLCIEMLPFVDVSTKLIASCVPRSH